MRHARSANICEKRIAPDVAIKREIYILRIVAQCLIAPLQILSDYVRVDGVVEEIDQDE